MSALICPTCLRIVPGRLELLLPRSLDHQARQHEVLFIHHETHCLYQHIAYFEEGKAGLLKRLNDIQSPIIRLPWELLSRILEYACFGQRYPFTHRGDPHAEYGTSHFIYSAVSFHWRQVVWSTPHLWSYIHLTIPGEREGETAGDEEGTEGSTDGPGTGRKREAEFLRTFIENSNDIPLTIILHYSKGVNPKSPHLIHESVDNLLIETLPRIEKIHLHNAPYCWQKYTPNLAQVREFALVINKQHLVVNNQHFVVNNQITIPSSAPLHSLDLQGVAWLSDVNAQRLRANLTSLVLSFIQPELAIQVFIQCPKLRTFHSISPVPQQPYQGHVTLTSPILFQRLTSFKWETDDNPWSRALIRYLHTPILCSMEWSTFDSESDNNSDIRAFFNRLPPTLKDLTLKKTTSHLQYIGADSNIETLQLFRCKASDLHALLDKLRPVQQGAQAIKPLPQLVKVVLLDNLLDDTTLEHIDTLDATYSTALMEILEQRRNEPHKPFHFEMETTSFKWRYKPRSKFREFSMNYKTRIIENSSHVGDEDEK